jgi:hypothetical protein
MPADWWLEMTAQRRKSAEHTPPPSQPPKEMNGTSKSAAPLTSHQEWFAARIMKIPPHRTWDANDEAFLRDMAGRYPATEIAKKLSRTAGAVRQKLFALGLTENRQIHGDKADERH